MKVLILRAKRYDNPAPDTPVRFELIKAISATITERKCPDGEADILTPTSFGYVARDEEGTCWVLYDDGDLLLKIDRAKCWYNGNSTLERKDISENIMNLDAAYAMSIQDFAQVTDAEGRPYVPDPAFIDSYRKHDSGPVYFYRTDTERFKQRGTLCHKCLGDRKRIGVRVGS